MRDPFGVAGRIDERDGRILRDAEQGEAVDAGRVDHRLEVSDPRVDREIAHFGVREAAPALVIANECVPVGEPAECRQTGLAQSYSRCVSHVAALTIGGPHPCTV
jgi:hypothetical protein